MAEEMRHHVELQTELNRRAGLNPDEARYAAQRKFGNVGSIQEQARAGKRGNIACVVTSFGIIAGIAPPDAVNVGRFQYKKAPVSIQ